MDPAARPAAETAAQPRAVIAVVEQLLEQGRPGEAEAALAPLLDRMAADFRIGRLHARCAADPAEALARWRAQAARFPGEPQAAIDLARALRGHAGHGDEADGVLAEAARRFPGMPLVLDAVAIAAEQRGDIAAAVTLWRDLLSRHPDHARARIGLVRCLLRLGQAGAAEREADAGLPPTPEAAPLFAVLAGQAEARQAWDAAARHWRNLRLSDPRREVGWLGEARMLAQLNDAAAREAVLREALVALPASLPIVKAAADSAVQRRDWSEALRRARLLQTLAPETLSSARLLSAALIGAGEDRQARAALAEQRRNHPDDAVLAQREVEVLCRLGLWQPALDAAAAAFNRFRDDSAAGRGLVTALLGLDRLTQAEAVLRDLRTRFTTERWILVEWARLAARRQDWRLAASWWRAAAPAADDQERIDHAMALAETDGVEAALAMLTEGGSRIAAARIALNLRRGSTDAALADWHRAAALQERTPEWYSATSTLAEAVDPGQAAPLIEALLNEPDQPGASWCPALAARLAATTPAASLALTTPAAARLHGQTAAILAARAEGGNGLAVACARNLCLPPPDADHLAGRMARAVIDGRPAVAALLLGQEDPAAHAARLRVAMRLLLNRNFATADRLDKLAAERAVLLLTLARAFDAESLEYLRDLLRPRFPAATVPGLPTPEHVVGAIVHAPAAPEPDSGRISRRLRVALCLHGRWPGGDTRESLLAGLGLSGHDVTVFAHLWPLGPQEGVTDAALLDRLPDGLRGAMAATGLDRAMTQARGQYPRLLSGAAAAGDAAPWQPEHGVIEDDGAPSVATQSEGWRARCKALLAHRLAAAAVRDGQDFDLYVHLRADRSLALRAPDWGAMAAACLRGPVVFADQGYHLRPRDGLSVGTALMIGAPRAMTIASDSFALGEMVASGRAEIWDFPRAMSEAGTLGLTLHLQGVSVMPLAVAPRLRRSEALAPLSPAEALALLWADVRSRPAQPHDSRLVSAATAEVVGGVPV